MLYLEDYLELIEHLPQELRDRFTDIRERDLRVHNSAEQLKDKVKLFFAEAKKLKPEQKQCNFEKLLGEYGEAMKHADDKVSIASAMHEIMLKLVQRLDTELEKFKLELEADHVGITEELEKRSLEMDADTTLDNIINSHSKAAHNRCHDGLNHSSANKVTSGIKDRRRSEHKQHRHHPYQNNQFNGYNHERAKLSLNGHHNNSTRNPHHNNHHRQHPYHAQGGSKFNHFGAMSCRQQATPSPTAQLGSINSAPPSVAGDSNGNEGTGHYGNNLSSYNTGFNRNSSSIKNNSAQGSNSYQTPNSQHSALSAALSSANPQVNTVPALAMLNATSVNSEISNNFKSSDLIDPSSPLVRQNPLAAAASQAIAATQQLQHGRRTPSLKASFAAISAASLGSSIDGLGGAATGGNKEFASGGNRNALAPMAPDQQALRYGQFGGTKNVAGANGNSNPLFISFTKSGRPTKRPKHRASHLYTDESPTSISSDNNSIFENSESLSSIDYIETGTTFGSTSPPSLDFAASNGQGNNAALYRDEKKYCVCRQISYGEMVACDNNECEIEWFHYDCVGITQPPKGKWFCPDCAPKMTSHQQLSSSHQPITHKKRGRKEKSVFNLVNNPLDADKASEQSDKNIV